MRADPEFEWVMAARWAGYTWDDFQEKEGDDQSYLVAAYRCHVQMEAVLEHERAKDIERRARRKGRK